MCSIHHRLFAESFIDCVCIADCHTFRIADCVTRYFTNCASITGAFSNELPDVIVNVASNT